MTQPRLVLVNQQVFDKYGTCYICVHPCRLELVKLSFKFSTEPINEQSSQYNYNHKIENRFQNQKTEIYNSIDSETECSDTNETPPQNEHNINADITSYQSNHQDTHSTTTSPHQEENQYKSLPKSKLDTNSII